MAIQYKFTTYTNGFHFFNLSCDKLIQVIPIPCVIIINVTSATNLVAPNENHVKTFKSINIWLQQLRLAPPKITCIPFFYPNKQVKDAVGIENFASVNWSFSFSSPTDDILEKRPTEG